MYIGVESFLNSFFFVYPHVIIALKTNPKDLELKNKNKKTSMKEYAEKGTKLLEDKLSPNVQWQDV